MNKYSRELNYFNAFACLGVILIHVLSIGITGLDKSSFQLAIIYIPWKIAAYVVPAFLFSGAVKMALSFDKSESYFKYIFKRFLKIYVPYCLWVVIYYLYFLRLGWVEKSFSALLKYILIGDLSAQFYYVIIVMQFYVLAPLWKIIVNKIPPYISLTCAGLITVFMYRFEPFLAQFNIQFQYKSRLFLSYIIFWVLGLYVGKYYDKIKEALIKSKACVLFSSVFVLAYGLLMYWQHSTGKYVYDGDPLKLFTDILTIIIMLTICILIENYGKSFLKGVLTFIHKASFSVFLSHCLVLQIVTNELSGRGIKDFGILLFARILACYTIPFILWFIWDKIKKIKLKRG